MPSAPKFETPLPAAWEAWCHRGRPSVGLRRSAVRRCMNAKGEVRGYYSDLLLDPELPDTHALYPSIEHITFPKQHGEIVVETRVVNDMKCILSEEEFWHAIEHLSFCRRRSEEDSLSDCSE